MTVLHFVFDYISPYAYLAWHALKPLAEKYDLDVRPSPVLFAGLLNAHGQLGPAEIPAKRRYVFTDVVRSAQRLEIELAAPFSHPFNPLSLLRATLAVDEVSQQRLLVDALFRGIWIESLDSRDNSWIADAMAQVGCPKGLERVREAKIKNALRVQTQEAIGRGIFGVPSMVVGEQMFWGLDSLPNLEAYLEGKYSDEPALLSAFLELGATAQRPR